VDSEHLREKAEAHRTKSSELSEEAERLSSERARLLKKAGNLSYKAKNSAVMRDECSREAAKAEELTEAWREKRKNRARMDAADLTGEDRQIVMHSQTSKSMRSKEKKAESDRIRFEREAEACRTKAEDLKRKIARLRKDSSKEYELYIGCAKILSEKEN
jgi:hypothetical protein